MKILNAVSAFIMLLTVPSLSPAITASHIDAFETGTTLGWGSGATITQLADGGSDGSKDGYLQISQTGFHVGAMNSNQWKGDYLNADISAIKMALNPISVTPSSENPDGILEIRLVLFGPGGAFSSTNSTALEAGWNSYVFDLSDTTFLIGSGSGWPGSGTQILEDTLADVNKLLIRHDPDDPPTAVGDHPQHITATLGIDNIEAITRRLAGDANLDGVVSADDYASVQSNFGNTNGTAGDANDDGVVSADDYASVQSNFGNTAGLQAAISATAASQAPTAHFSFNETSAGTWAISTEVTGDTAGLSAYSIWIRGVHPSQVIYEEGTLGTIGDGFTPRGFQSSTFLSGDVGGDFNAGNFQSSGDAAIPGIAKDAVEDAGVIPGTTPHVQLDVPALLGTLTTPEGLGKANFEATSVGLLNPEGNGFLTDPPTPTYEVNPFVIPEPASLGLLILSYLTLLRRRHTPFSGDDSPLLVFV